MAQDRFDQTTGPQLLVNPSSRVPPVEQKVHALLIDRGPAAGKRSMGHNGVPGDTDIDLVVDRR